MKTIKILTMLAVFFISSLLNAQDTTKPFYFPHKTGDMWEYLYFEFGTSYVDTVQNFTISDSIDSEGNIHITQYARSINPVGGPYLFLDTMNYMIDSFNVYGPYFYNYQNRLVYKLKANKGDQWVLEGEPGHFEIARVEDKWKKTIFSIETTFMRMHYYSAVDSTDTSAGIGGLDRYYDEIADGFGLVFRLPAEYFGEIHLIGAVINGELFGDTTLVSVKDRRDLLPLSIKLNQNYPNPFNPSTTISFELSQLSNISLIIYDVLGKEIYRLVDNKDFYSGEHKVVWKGINEDRSKAASGIYFYRLVTDNQVLTRSMILLK